MSTFTYSPEANARRLIEISSKLPRRTAWEYDVAVPTKDGELLMKVTEQDGFVSFNGYKALPGNEKGPAEAGNCIRNIGDKFIAVDGVSTIGMSIDDIIAMLRASALNKFSFLRLRGVVNYSEAKSENAFLSELPSKEKLSTHNKKVQVLQKKPPCQSQKNASQLSRSSENRIFLKKPHQGLTSPTKGKAREDSSTEAICLVIDGQDKKLISPSITGVENGDDHPRKKASIKQDRASQLLSSNSGDGKSNDFLRQTKKKIAKDLANITSNAEVFLKPYSKGVKKRIDDDENVEALMPSSLSNQRKLLQENPVQISSKSNTQNFDKVFPAVSSEPEIGSVRGLPGIPPSKSITPKTDGSEIVKLASSRNSVMNNHIFLTSLHDVNTIMETTIEREDFSAQPLPTSSEVAAKHSFEILDHGLEIAGSSNDMVCDLVADVAMKTWEAPTLTMVQPSNIKECMVSDGKLVDDSNDNHTIKGRIRKRICSYKSIVDTKERKRQKSESMVCKVLRAKRVDEYQSKDTRNIPVAYAIRLSEIDRSNEIGHS
jgi:hypothetical protein